jgi:thiaminase
MVAAIGDGTLPHETFRFYFEQNVQYLHLSDSYVWVHWMRIGRENRAGAPRLL